jgi:mono/diheme cytochrome c family protein
MARAHDDAVRFLETAMTCSWRFAISLASLAIGACASLPQALSLSAPPAMPDIPAYGPQRSAVWLEQGWTPGERERYHHRSQGTATLPVPLAWFMALEQPDPSLSARGLFSDPAYLDRFGFIPDGISGSNPQGLPVGLAVTRGVNPSTGEAFEQIGFTCAACHTGRMTYNGTQIFVDGGPAMIELGKFRKGLADALAMTSLSPPRFKRFADRVLGPRHSPASGLRLHNQLGRTVAGAVIARFKTPSPKGSLDEGFGRLDALNRIGNEVFGDQMRQPANFAALSAPVAYPHIWDTAWFDWVQYNSSIEQPMVRNAGEAMGVRALINFTSARTPRFTSTVPVDALHDMETLLAGSPQPTAGRAFTGLRSPAWPTAILPSINVALKEQGRTLYRQLCASCHLPATDEPAFWTSSAWLPPNSAGDRYLRLRTVAVADIGTDPAQAEDMKSRQVRVPLAYQLKTAPAAKAGMLGIYPYGLALGDVVEKVVYQWYDSRTPPTPPADRARMNGFRPNGIRAGIAGPDGTVRAVYKARPLNGVWATAPFLHNGSVPTLYDLLSPWVERPRSFWLGNREFDPVKVGYRTGEIQGGFKLVAVDANGRLIRGNGNGGHLFESPTTPDQTRPGTIGRYLQPQERLALVEFLKTL